MIYFFSTRRGAVHTFDPFLKDWIEELQPDVELVLYEELLINPPKGDNTFIFTDIDRLNRYQRSILKLFVDQLVAAHPGCRIINHPEKVITRFNLLRQLHKENINEFNIYPITELRNHIRFPVFLRNPNEHFGPFTELLDDFGDVRVEAYILLMKGVIPSAISAIEYCETKSPDGWYRKYSAFRFGETIIPAHINFGEHWITKDGEITTEEMLQEKQAFTRDNPHADDLMKIFNMANIEYGRIDYAFKDGRMQIWEINTNPILIKAKEEYDATVLHIKEELAVKIRAGLSALNQQGEPVEGRLKLKFPAPPKLIKEADQLK